MNCLATVLATKRRNTVAVAMPRTPPSFFLKTRHVGQHEGAKDNVRDCGTCCDSGINIINVSFSSKQTRNISFVQPPGPRTLPERALLRQTANDLESNLEDANCLTSNGTYSHVRRRNIAECLQADAAAAEHLN